MSGKCVCLEECEGAVFSYSPWVYRSGSLNLLACGGRIEAVENCPAGAKTVSCSGLYAVPCPFDAVIVPSPPNSAEWYDELYGTLGMADEELVEKHSSLGYCGGVVYGKLVASRHGYRAAGTIVTPNGTRFDIRGSDVIVAAVSVSRKSVYSLRSKFGKFPVDWLREEGLLGDKTVVVGSWIASWEVEALRETGALLAVAPVAQALYRGGPPPRPQYRGLVVLATGGLLDTPWALAYAALVEYAAVYWGIVDAEDILAGLARGWKLLGIEPRLGAAPVALVEARGFEGDPKTLILSRPVHRGSVWPGVEGG